MTHKFASFLLLAALAANVAGSGVLPAAPAGIAFARAIPYNVPPFAAAVSFLRTGAKPWIAPVAALLPPHLHAPVASLPHFHAAHFGFAGVPAILPHAASLVPHVGVVPAPVVPGLVPHVHPYAAVAPGVVPAPHVHVHANAYGAPALVPATPNLHPAQALPHAHGPAAFAPLVARSPVHHTHLDALHHYRK